MPGQSGTKRGSTLPSLSPRLQSSQECSVCSAASTAHNLLRYLLLSLSEFPEVIEERKKSPFENNILGATGVIDKMS